MVSRYETVGTEYLLDLLEGDGDLLVGMGCHEAEADERVVGRHSRRNNRVDKDSLVQEVARDGESLVVVTDEKRDDGSLGVTDFTSHITESLQRLMGNLPQVLLTLRLGNEDINRLHCSCRRSRGNAGREDVAARMMTQVISDDLAGIDKISYSKKAEPVEYDKVLEGKLFEAEKVITVEEALSEEEEGQVEEKTVKLDTVQYSDVPSDFKKLMVTFVLEDENLEDGRQIIAKVKKDYGESITADEYPGLKNKDGFYASWDVPELSDTLPEIRSNKQ